MLWFCGQAFRLSERRVPALVCGHGRDIRHSPDPSVAKKRRGWCLADDRGTSLRGRSPVAQDGQRESRRRNVPADADGSGADARAMSLRIPGPVTGRYGDTWKETE